MCLSVPSTPLIDHYFPSSLNYTVFTMVRVMKNSDPVQKQAKQIVKTAEQCDKLKQVKAEYTAAFNQALQDMCGIIRDLIYKLSNEFSYNSEYTAEKLHLGSHALRQQWAAAINNAYAHCMATCEKECMCMSF